MLSFISSKKQSNWLKDIYYLTIFFIVFYSLFIGSYALFTPDEGRYAEIGREMSMSNDYITPRLNGLVFFDKPILHYWLQAISIYFFGAKEWAVRLMPILIGIGNCLITYIAGRHLFNRQAGILASIILATSPLYFGMTHYANIDLEVAAFISACLLFFITGFTQEIHQKRRFFLLGAYIFAGLAVLTKGLIGAVLPGTIILTWLIYTKKIIELKNVYLFRGLFLFFLITVPWYSLIQINNSHFFHYFFVTQQFSRFLSAGEFNNAAPWWFYIPVISLGFFPWMIFFISSLKAIFLNLNKNNILLFLFLWMGIIFTFFSIPKAKIVSYILPLFPAMALITGYYLSERLNTIRHSTLLLLIIVYSILSIISSILLFSFTRFPTIEILSEFNFYLIIISLVFLLSSFFSLFILFKKPELFKLIIICIITNILFLITLTHGAGYLNQDSAKPLVTQLKTIKKPQDEIISYYKYYYDVPFYLQQTILVAADWQDNGIKNKDNWRRELWIGKLFEPTLPHPNLIDEKTFWAHFHDNNRRVFVFLNENYLDQFKSQAGHYFYLGKNNDIFLYSNQPIIEN